MDVAKTEYLHRIVGGFLKSYAFYLAIFASLLTNGTFNQIRAFVYYRRYFRDQRFDYREILIAQWTSILSEPCLFVMEVRFIFLSCESLPLSQVLAFFVVRQDYWRLLVKDSVFYIYAAALWLITVFCKRKLILIQLKTSLLLTLIHYLFFVCIFMVYYSLTLTALSYSNMTLDTFYVVFEILQLLKCFSNIFVIKMYELTMNLTRMYDFPHYRSVEEYFGADKSEAGQNNGQVTYHVPFVHVEDFEIE